MRVATAIVSSAVVTAALVAIVSVGGYALAQPTYPVPQVGQVDAIVGPGDAPAFLAHDLDGTVRAFLGIAPHSGLPLAWCPDAELFVEPVGAAKFDRAGRYAFGPAPGGLRPYATERAGDQVRLGALLEPPGRTPPGAVFPGRDLCAASEGHIFGVRPPTAQLGALLRPTEAARRHGWVRVEGRLEPYGDRFLVCGPDATMCNRTSPVAAEVFDGIVPDGPQPLLALANGGGFTAVVAPLGAREAADAWCAETELRGASIRRTADSVAIELHLAEIRVLVRTLPGCNYDRTPPPPELLGASLTLPLAEHEIGLGHMLASVVVPAGVRETDGPFPAQGQPGDLAADGTVTSAELAAALGIADPVTVTVKHEGGEVSDVWIDRRA